MKQKTHSKRIDFAQVITILIVAASPLMLIPMSVLTTAMEASVYGQKGMVDVFSYFRGHALAVLVFLFFIVFVLRLLTRELKVPKELFIGIPLALIVLTLISHMNAIDPVVSARGIFDRYEGVYLLISYYLSFIIAYCLKFDDAKLLPIARALCLSSILYTGIGVLQFFGFDPIANLILSMNPAAEPAMSSGSIVSLPYAAYGLFSNPNYLGSYAVLVAPWCLYLYAHDPRFKYVSFTAFVLTFVTVFMAKSLGGIVTIALATAILVPLLLSQGASRKKIYTPVAIATLSVIASFILSPHTPLNQETMTGLAGVWGLLAAAEFIKVLLARYTIQKVVTGVITSFLLLGGASFAGLLHLYEKPDLYVNALTTTNDTITMDYTLSGEPHLLSIKRNEPNYTIVNDDNTYMMAEGQKEMLIQKSTSTEVKLEIQHYENYDVCIIRKPGAYFIVEDTGISFIDRTKKRSAIGTPAHIPIAGYEKLGNGRAYILSRSIPLISKYPVWGAGPDNFSFVFPQNDFVGKANSGSGYIVVDKPHNWYIQTAVNTGLLSSILLISLLGLYFLQIFKRKLLQSGLHHLLPPMIAGIAGYMLIQMFNDSIVGVASIFWVLFGLYAGYVHRTEKFVK